jgi:hypothetical protein
MGKLPNTILVIISVFNAFEVEGDEGLFKVVHPPTTPPPHAVVELIVVLLDEVDKFELFGVV